MKSDQRKAMFANMRGKMPMKTLTEVKDGLWKDNDYPSVRINSYEMAQMISDYKTFKKPIKVKWINRTKVFGIPILLPKRKMHTF